MLKGAALLTCFNRKELTLECIRKLINQSLHEKFTINIYLVDDGSSDGTSEAIKNTYPEVTLIHGDGNLFWNGGMRLAWKTAQNHNYDFYLWLNDDCMIAPDAIYRLINCYQALINENNNVGAITTTMVDPISNIPSYGGRSSLNKFTPIKMTPVIFPKDTAITCDMMNGNLVLIPNSSVKKIGILSNKYTHSLGDFDYSFRLAKAGLQCWIAPGVFGSCSLNSSKGTWKDKTLPFKKRLGLLKLPNQLDPSEELLYFIKEHGGYSWPLLWLKIWIKSKLPFLWLL